jgi:hypothetical protein
LELSDFLAFVAMYSNPQAFKAKLYSIELRKGDDLVAVELGYSIGSTYTSQTGTSSSLPCAFAID